MTEPIAVIGDIHGELEKLMSLLADVRERRLVFVGDYINRGKSSRLVLERLAMLSDEAPNSVFLLGNHEASLLSYMDGALPFHKFAGIGGLSTLKDYLPHAVRDVRSEFVQIFPPRHLHFLMHCTPFFETDEVLVSHCGVHPNRRGSRAFSDMVNSTHEGLFSGGVQFDKLIVCGHYTQISGAPYVGNSLICLDTGAGRPGGRVTVLLLPEMEFLQY